MKKPALWVTPGKKLSILQSGEILKEESAVIKTVVTTIWGIPQIAVPTSISVFTKKAFTCFFLHELSNRASSVQLCGFFHSRTVHYYAFKNVVG